MEQNDDGGMGSSSKSNIENDNHHKEIKTKRLSIDAGCLFELKPSFCEPPYTRPVRTVL